MSNFTIFHQESDNWQAQKTNKFDLFEDLDDFPNPLSVGQLLPNLSGQVDPDVIWDLTTGDFDALELIEDESTKAKALRIMERLDDCGAWADSSDHENSQSNDLNLSIDFEHCSSCGYDTLHIPVEELAGSKLVCSDCETNNSGIYQI